MKQKVAFTDLGRIDYQEAWDLQTRLNQELIAQKRQPEPQPPLHHFLFCEHDPVYTLGKSGSKDNLLLDSEGLDANAVQFYKINRGGDITYHGPGQVVGYPIFDLDCFFTDIHRYIRSLEEAIIRTLADFGISGTRMEGYTGVWLKEKAEKKRQKICAIGVHLSRWVTMHGFALNVNTDLQYFGHIIPCGITDQDKEVTTMAAQLGSAVDMDAVKRALMKHFSEIFEFEIVESQTLST